MPVQVHRHQQPTVSGQPIEAAIPLPNRADRRAAHRRHIDLDQPGFLRLEEVLAVIPVSRATWYAGVKAGEYPAQVKLGVKRGKRRSVAWKTQDIKALVEQLSATATSN